MKNTNLKLNKTKLVARLMIVILLLASTLTLASCGKKGLEIGFEWRQHPDGSSRYFCACTSDKNEFEKDNVALTFYYGGIEGIAWPVFRIYFENDNGDIVTIKEVKDHKIDDYMVVLKTKKILFYHTYEKSFKYSETITIPEELFVNENGYILFGVDGGEPTESGEVKWHNLCREGIYYRIKDNTVMLTEKSFD